MPSTTKATIVKHLVEADELFYLVSYGAEVRKETQSYAHEHHPEILLEYYAGLALRQQINGEVGDGRVGLGLEPAFSAKRLEN